MVLKLRLLRALMASMLWALERKLFRRFSLQHGLTAAGQKNLETHLAAQLASSPSKPFPADP
jgi:hypothetical protein